MQTFLPYANFTESAKVLDYKRLGKQRVEVLQLLQALAKGPVHWVSIDNDEIMRVTPWYNHPAAKMWRGHESALALYGLAICDAWIEHGYKDTCKNKILRHIAMYPGITLPAWLGDEAFHASHRSNLLRKDPEYYGQFGWTEPENLPYVWPVP